MKHVKTGHARPVVCLDAGHYAKYNRSPVVPDYYESDMNWKLHLLLENRLLQYGIEVRLTRKDKQKDLNEYYRGTAAKGCDLLLSIHSNAAAKETVDYPAVYVPLDGSGNELGEALARCIEETMDTVDAGRIATRKGQNGDYYGVIRGAAAVGVTGIILEHSFHTNARATRWLMDESNLERMADAEAKIIANWFGVKKQEDKPAAEPEQIYRIRKSWADAGSQIGAYKNLEYAKNACPKGYSVFDCNGKAVYSNSTNPAETYSLEQFVRDIQKAVGAAVDGVAGPETLGKTVTLSARTNATHATVKPVQKRLRALGYTEAGTADGIAGPKFTSAVAHFQQDNGCVTDGEISGGCLTWKKLLGMV